MTVRAGHTALNIGLRDEVERHLACQPQEDRNEQSGDDQFRFRMARIDGEKNPYRKLIPSCHHANVCRFVAEAANSKKPLAVQLFGGLGDQLELLSLMLPWGSRHSVPLRLLAEEQRCQLFAPLLPDNASIEPGIQKRAHPAQSMAIRLGVFEHDPPADSKPGFKPRRPIPIRSEWCCWRAEGQGLPVRAQPVSALSTSAQVLSTTDGAGTSNKNRRHHGMEAMEMQPLQQLGVTLQPCRSGLKGACQLVPGTSCSQHRHRSDPSMCSYGPRS